MGAHRVRFLLDPDTGAAAAGAATPAEAVADPTPVAAAGAEAAPPEGTPSPEPAAPAWTGPSQDEWLETQQLLRQLATPQQPAEPAGLPGQPEPLRPPDPFSENYDAELADYLEARDERLLSRFEQMIAPVASYTEQQQHEENEQRALDMIQSAENAAGVDLGSARGFVRAMADVYVGEAAQRYGMTPKAAEAAIDRAVKELADWRRAEREAAVNEYKAQLEQASGQPPQPGASGGGGPAIHTYPDATDEVDLIDQIFARGGV